MSDARVDRLAAAVADRGLDQLLVGDLVRPGDSGRDATANLRWLTGFGGTSGLAIVGGDRRAFVTDFRYAERAEREVFDGFDRTIAERELVPASIELLRGRVGYDDAHTSVKTLRQLGLSTSHGNQAANGALRPRNHRPRAPQVERAERASRGASWTA